MSNAFERYVETQNLTRRPARVKVVESDKQAPKRLTAQEKDQREQERQFALYRKAKTAEHQHLVAKYPEYLELCQLLRALSPGTSASFASYIKRSRWLDRLDAQERCSLLSIIDTKIGRIRVQAGLPVFDDPLPSFDGSFEERANLFLVIRKELMGY